MRVENTTRNLIELETSVKRFDHLIRVRVLQELELLALTLQTRPRYSSENPVMRRLTRAEWKQVKETGIIPFENAVAILLVPPPNKNPETKLRPTPSDSPQPIAEEPHPVPNKPLPPVSTLHLTAGSGLPIDVLVGTPQYLPPAKVPLYNGIAAFPSRAQRAALYKALNRILAIERRARWRQNGRLTDKRNARVDADEGQKQKMRARGDQKASHAYVLFSDSKSVLRADTVPLAIALWRLRLWEGAGWDKQTKKTGAGGWMIIKPLTLPQ